MKGKYRAVEAQRTSRIPTRCINLDLQARFAFCAHTFLVLSRRTTPGNLQVVGEPPMCVDAPSMQWFADAKAHKPKPTNTVPGITYMLADATQRSDSDPYDAMSPPITVGPHWMIMWPFDPKTTGLPTTQRPTGAYIMWAGSPYAHVHIMGRP